MSDIICIVERRTPNSRIRLATEISGDVYAEDVATALRDAMRGLGFVEETVDEWIQAP